MDRKSLCEFIGPFIGIEGNDYKILLAKPLGEVRESISCVFKYKNIEKEVFCEQSDLLFGLRAFHVPPEFPKNKIIHYYFKKDGCLIENIDKLSPEDLWFKNVEVSKISKTALLSCNNPYSFSSKKVDRNNMWDKLNDESFKNETELVILAGDQLYNDNLERVLKSKNIDREKLTKLFIRNYLIYFGIESRKKIMARIPSIAIWDDHDITDGYGSRPEQFKNKDNKKKWTDFFEVAQKCFIFFQASRNPSNKFSKSFTNYLDIKNTRIYLLDFRSNRDFTQNKLMHNNDFDDFEKSIQTMSPNITNIVVVSPVIIARSTKNFDRLAKLIGKGLYITREILLRTIGTIGDTDIFVRKVFSKLMIPDLCDDLDDSLGSDKNCVEFGRIIKSLLPVLEEGKSLQFFSGDIHTGGRATLKISTFNSEFEIPVIVSSPIAYQPMGSLVEKLTTAKKQINILTEENFELSQENDEYISERNFALLEFTDEKLIRKHYYEFHARPVLESIEISKPIKEEIYLENEIRFTEEVEEKK